MMKWVGQWVAVLMIAVGPAQAQEALPDYVIANFGQPPVVPRGALSGDLAAAVAEVLGHARNQSDFDPVDRSAFETIAASGDARVVWLFVDMLRFTWRPEFAAAITRTSLDMTGIRHDTNRHLAIIKDHMIAWDIPAYPGYLDHKRAIYTNYLEGMEQIFQPGDVDWRHVGWGGVRIDARPFGQTDETCHCIPAADNPQVSTAAEATWLSDDAIVFGVGVNGEYRAYPRRIMEIREMVNDTLGGRDLGIPYCTLCGAAQAYFTDQLPAGVARPVLRTSGLLIRSNKVMYDITSGSVFDTFRGNAVTGPLAAIGLELEQASVVTTTWGDWKAAHSETTVLVEALALGRDFDLRNTRDADGPIFPVGDVDPRLPVHEDIIGIITASGAPVAFQRSTLFAALSDGAKIMVDGIELVMDGGGIRAQDAEGNDVGSHQAFWFAWSQFYPDTVLWTG